MILATSWTGILAVMIPLSVVVGIFIVEPLLHRRRDPAERFIAKLDAIADTQQQILTELQTVTSRLDQVEHVLTTVD